jgi:hypothetical protein
MKSNYNPDYPDPEKLSEELNNKFKNLEQLSNKLTSCKKKEGSFLRHDRVCNFFYRTTAPDFDNRTYQCLLKNDKLRKDLEECMQEYDAMRMHK